MLDTRLGASLICATLLWVCPIPALAQAQVINISSGTGFFVSRDGYVVTNNHVISQCKATPEIQGPVGRVSAQIVASDPANDLALLKASTTPGGIAKLRADSPALQTGEALAIIGYPGNAGADGRLTILDAKLISDKGPGGEEKWLQFSNSVQHGNSGGPLLDSSGNVVGVIMAKSQTFIYNATAARQEKTGEADIAISLSTLRPFLDRNHVLYTSEPSNNYLATHRVLDRSREFIVNVQCRI